jgi:hypothetical protein
MFFFLWILIYVSQRDGCGVDLVKWMQLGGDLENSWMMLDHVKHVQGWTTMACHVF